MSASRVAECQCGKARVVAEGEPLAVVACHCVACQRRTGSVFGVGAYYAPDQLAFSGETRPFERPCDSGETLVARFCPSCGTSIAWSIPGEEPARVGVAVGCFGDAAFPAPIRSVWEQSRHPWVGLDGVSVRFPQGRDSGGGTVPRGAK